MVTVVEVRKRNCLTEMDDQMREKIEFLTKFELQERLERQRKLLANRKFLQRLPDKGKKIEEHVEKLKQMISEKEKVEETVERFSELSLERNVDDHENIYYYYDDDNAKMDDDVPPEKMRVSQYKQKAAKKKHFKLNVPKNPTSDENKELSETWNYESAITNPKSQLKSSKTLSVEESMRLQKEQTKRLQKLETENAAQRLQEYSMSSDSTMSDVRVSNPYKYRNKEEFDPLESDSSDVEEADTTELNYDGYDDVE